MNKTVIRKQDSDQYDFIIEFAGVINPARFLNTYSGCNVVEEKYTDDVLVETIIHEL